MSQATQYRLYSRDPCELVGTYNTPEAAFNTMYEISYDCDPKEFFYIKCGSEQVWPEGREMMWA